MSASRWQQRIIPSGQEARAESRRWGWVPRGDRARSCQSRDPGGTKSSLETEAREKKGRLVLGAPAPESGGEEGRGRLDCSWLPPGTWCSFTCPESSCPFRPCCTVSYVDFYGPDASNSLCFWNAWNQIQVWCGRKHRGPGVRTRGCHTIAVNFIYSKERAFKLLKIFF